MSNGWEGEKVRLVGLDKGRHLENALVWINNPEATQWTLVGDMPMTRLAEEDFFRRMTESPGAHPTDIALAIETLEGEHIGFSGFHRIEWRHGAAHTGTIIGAGDYRGKGYGSDAARTRTRYAFEVLGLRLLLSEVMADNVASFKMLLGAGYKEVGRIPRRHWKRGAYRDEILLAVEREAV